MRDDSIAILLAAFTMMAPLPALAQAAPEVPTSRTEMQLSFAPVVKQVVPSVVNVYATRLENAAASPFAGDPFFGQFFGLDSPLFGSRPQESKDLGSGVIVADSGVILTNSHVVSGADDIRISTADSREYGVDLVLDDPKDDLAVLKIREPGQRKFPALDFADSDKLQVGDLVLAIGNPFGVGQTVTSGIVSAIARTSIDGEQNQFFVQTDAAINPGNSGGALVDLSGRLVGINTALFSKSGGSVGIGFAIPANMAKMVATAGLTGGKLQRAWLGARLQPLTAELAGTLKIDPPQGALVTEIADAGPAAKAGLQPSDVIVAIDGAPVADPQEFSYRFATHAVGTDARLSVVRNGAPETVALAVQPAALGAEAEIAGTTRFAGVTAADLTPAFADDLGLPYDAKGVVIAEVKAGSSADQMGLKRGDIVVNLQGQDITSVDEFKALTAGRPQAWQIILQRDGRVLRSIVEG